MCNHIYACIQIFDSASRYQVHVAPGILCRPLYFNSTFAIFLFTQTEFIPLLFQATVNTNMRTLEKEVFDNVDMPPYRDGGDYIDTTSPSIIHEEVFDYQNVPNERRPSVTGSEIRGQSRSEGEGQSTQNTTPIVDQAPSPMYSNSEMEAETSDEVVYSSVTVADIQMTTAELRPKLSNTSSSNSYTHSPVSSPKYKEEIRGSLTEEESYYLLCEASSEDVYSKCMPFPNGDSSFNYIPHHKMMMM